MSMSTGQALLTLLEADVLGAVGEPLGTFLAAEAAAQGDPAKLLVAWMQFQGNLAPALIKFEIEVQTQLIGLFQGKFNTFAGQVQANLAAAEQKLGMPPPPAAAPAVRPFAPTLTVPATP